MKYQRSFSRTVLATIIFSGGAFALPVLAHQNMDSNKTHHDQQADTSSTMMMAGKMGNMDMSLMMEKMSSMDMSMMMSKNQGMNMMRMMGITNLTDEQQNSINQLHDSMRKSHWELMGLAMDERVNLRDAMAADRPDPKNVGGIYGRLFDLKRKMIESQIETHNGVLDLLTEEQAEQMKNNMMMSGGHDHGAKKGATMHGS